MKKVNVLLPTYNGEKYLEYQLQSVVNQTYKNIDVYIREDGSKDNTMEIIDRFCQKSYEGIKFIKVESDGKNLGYPDCFWELIKKAKDAEYYAFCDQDDWWNPKKIEIAVNELEKIPKEKPAMTYCEFEYYDKDMNYIRPGDNYSGELTFEKGIYYTFAPGFTQVINKALVDKLDLDYIFGKNLAHDIWCQWIALTMGEIVTEHTVLAKYRRHEDAVTAANASKRNEISRWIKKEIFGDEIVKWKRSLCYFKDEYYNEINENEQYVLALFANENDTFTNKVKKIFYKRKLRPTAGGNFALKILFLIGKC